MSKSTKSEKTEQTERGKRPSRAERADPALPGRAGWLLRPWCDSASICPATLYNLPTELRPISIKLGKRRIITESPADWLRRMKSAEVGGDSGARLSERTR